MKIMIFCIRVSRVRLVVVVYILHQCNCKIIKELRNNLDLVRSLSYILLVVAQKVSWYICYRVSTTEDFWGGPKAKTFELLQNIFFGFFFFFLVKYMLITSCGLTIFLFLFLFFTLIKYYYLIWFKKLLPLWTKWSC